MNELKINALQLVTKGSHRQQHVNWKMCKCVKKLKQVLLSKASLLLCLTYSENMDGHQHEGDGCCFEIARINMMPGSGK